MNEFIKNSLNQIQLQLIIGGDLDTQNEDIHIEDMEIIIDEGDMLIEIMSDDSEC